MTRWENNQQHLKRLFEFNNFQEALKFVNKVGQLAEIQNHHPDIRIHDYRKVEITLTTHDKNYTVSDKDHRLANSIDRIDISKCQ